MFREFLFLLITWPHLAITDEHERRLYDTLLANYNVLERPVDNNSMPVQVKLQIILNQIIDVVRDNACSVMAYANLCSLQDEKNQIIHTNIWMKYVRLRSAFWLQCLCDTNLQEWNDTYLQWNPNDFGGVADVRIPMGRIWYAFRKYCDKH